MSQGLAVGLAMFAVMLGLMAIRIPIAAAMFIPGAIGYAIVSDSINLMNLLKGSAVSRLTVYELSVIPLFLLMALISGMCAKERLFTENT